MSGCGCPAAGSYTWGVYPAGDHNKDVPLCPAHAAEVWAEAKGPTSAGLMHFAVSPVAGG